MSRNSAPSRSRQARSCPISSSAEADAAPHQLKRRWDPGHRLRGEPWDVPGVGWRVWEVRSAPPASRPAGGDCGPRVSASRQERARTRGEIARLGGATACASSQSASHGFRGAAGPWSVGAERAAQAAALEARSLRRCRSPSHDPPQRLGAGVEDRPAGVILEARPSSASTPGSSSLSSSTSPIILRSPATVCSGRTPAPAISPPPRSR